MPDWVKKTKKETGRGYIANDMLVQLVKGSDGEVHRKFIDNYAKYLFPTVGKQGEYNHCRKNHGCF